MYIQTPLPLQPACCLYDTTVQYTAENKVRQAQRRAATMDFYYWKKNTKMIGHMPWLHQLSLPLFIGPIRIDRFKKKY